MLRVGLVVIWAVAQASASAVAARGGALSGSAFAGHARFGFAEAAAPPFSESLIGKAAAAVLALSVPLALRLAARSQLAAAESAGESGLLLARDCSACSCRCCKGSHFGCGCCSASASAGRHCAC